MPLSTPISSNVGEKDLLIHSPSRAQDPVGFTRNLAFAVSAAVLGSAFQHGYNTGVLNAPQKIIESFVNETYEARNGEYLSKPSLTMIWSMAVSIYCIGGMVGGLLTAVMAEKLGRKRSLVYNNVFALLAGLLMGISKVSASYETIICGRFFTGLNSGLNAGLVPMYLNEISPSHLRGAIGTTYQLVITISILIAQVLGLPQCLGSEDRWPILLGLTAIPALFQLCTLPLCPESPKFTLLVQGREIEAQKALTWLRGTIEIHDEMDEMNAEAEAMKTVPKVTLKEMLGNPVFRMPLIISVVVMLSQQLSGINAVFFFSTTIFESAKLSHAVAQYATIGIGVINVIMTIISLVLVEKAGRKTLHLTGLSGMAVITVLLTICLVFKDSAPWVAYLCITSVVIFVVMFATGPGSIPWFLVTELFGQGARPLATSIAVTVNWSANFLVGLLFLPLADALGAYTFLVFTALLTIFCIFTFFFVPETRNKTPEEIAAFFRRKTYRL